MFKRLLWMAVGAAGALQAERWVRAQRARLTPDAMTGTVLDKVNQRLEAKRADAQQDASPGTRF
jgi:hypothetical protein